MPLEIVLCVNLNRCLTGQLGIYCKLTTLHVAIFKPQRRLWVGAHDLPEEKRKEKASEGCEI